MDLQQRIVSRQGEFLLFALTPPRLSTTREEAQQIADVTVARLEPLGVDGLILYDIDDEADRNARRSSSTARRRSTPSRTFATG